MSDPAENRDVRGNTIKPHSVEAENVKAKNATVESEPSEANEIARKVDIDAKADLDSTTGVLKSSQVPDLAITSVSTVPDQSSRLSLSVEEGDVAIQTDTDTTFIFTGGDPSVNSNWSEIVLDVLDAISGSTISPDTVNANSVNTAGLQIDGGRIMPLRLDAVFKDETGTSVTHTFGSSQDAVAILVRELGFENGGSDIQMRLNGNSDSNYKTRFTDNTTETAQNHITLSADEGGELTGWIYLFSGGGVVVSATGMLANIDFQPTMMQAQYLNQGSVNSVEIFDSDGDQMLQSNVQFYTFDSY